jgi:hypothetical protein
MLGSSIGLAFHGWTLYFRHSECWFQIYFYMRAGTALGLSTFAGTLGYGVHDDLDARGW